MFESGNFMKTTYLLEKSLDVESTRRRVIADNIANVDVPHFKRREVNFESELKRIVREREGDAQRYPGSLTNEKHIPFYHVRDITDAQMRINHDYSTSMRNDGNNVDIEKEMVDSSKNMMRYNAFVTRIGNKFSSLKYIMRTG